MSGAVGTAKHSVLIYALGFLEFVRLLQPDPPSRFGNAQSSPLFVLAGSEPVPQVAVKGTPSLAVKIRPSSHPPNAHWAGPARDFGVGTCHVPLITSVRPTLKSDGPRLNLISN